MCVILYVRVELLAQIFSLRNAVLFESLNWLGKSFTESVTALVSAVFSTNHDIPIIPIYKQIIAVLIRGG